MLLGWTVQPSARAPRTASRIAAPFGIGRAPGSPRHTGQTCVLGGAPNAVEQPQNIFAFVRSCTCVSSTITVSQAAEILSDQRPHLLRAAVVRLVETGGEHVGADQNAAPHLGPETLTACGAIQPAEIGMPVKPWPVPHAVVAREVRGGFGGRDDVVG